MCGHPSAKKLVASTTSWLVPTCEVAGCIHATHRAGNAGMEARGSVTCESAALLEFSDAMSIETSSPDCSAFRVLPTDLRAPMRQQQHQDCPCLPRVLARSFESAKLQTQSGQRMEASLLARLNSSASQRTRRESAKQGPAGVAVANCCFATSSNRLRERLTPNRESTLLATTERKHIQTPQRRSAAKRETGHLSTSCCHCLPKGLAQSSDSD